MTITKPTRPKTVPVCESCAEIFDGKRHLSLKSVAARLDCSINFLREHLADFPGAWRMGDTVRIPVKDIIALANARRIFQQP